MEIRDIEDQVLSCWYRQDFLKAELVLIQTSSGILRKKITEGGLKADVDAWRIKLVTDHQRLFDIKAELGRIQRFLRSEEVLDLLAE